MTPRYPTSRAQRQPQRERISPSERVAAVEQLVAERVLFGLDFGLRRPGFVVVGIRDGVLVIR